MGLILTQGLVIGGKEQPDYSVAVELHVNQTAGDINVTLTSTGGEDYRVQWGDGEYSDVTNGVEATHTYAEDYAGPLILRANSPVTVISSTDGDWDFDVAELPSTLTSLTMAYASPALTGSFENLPAALVTLDLSGSASNLEAGLDALPSAIEYLDLSSSSTDVSGSLSLLPSTITYLDLSNTNSAITGDLDDPPASLIYLALNSTPSVITAVNETTSMTSGTRAVYLQDTAMPSPTIDAVLAALATITTWVNEQAINLGGNNAPRTSDSDADKTTLEGNGVTVTVNEVATPAITFVQSDSAWAASGANITVDKPTGTIDDDVMIALCYLDGTDGTGVWTAPAGWTKIFDYTGTLARDRCLTAFSKVASSEGASYTFTNNGPGTANVSGAIIALKGVDTASILDATYVEANHVLDDDTEPFTSPNITTTTDGSWVLLMQAITHAFCTAGGAPSGYTLRLEQIGTQDGQILFATKEVSTAGAETPGDFTSTFSDNSGAASTVALAIKVAPSGGVIVTPSLATLSNNQAAGPVNLTVTTHDASTYQVRWGDGTISADIASGATALYTYPSAFDGDVTVHTDGNITSIASTDGGWDFALAALPSTCTVLNLGGTNAAVTGTLADLPSGMTDLQLFNTSSVITGNFGDEPSGMVTLYLSNTSSNIAGSFDNAASTFVNLSLRSSSSTAAFNFANFPSSLRLLRLHDSSCTIDASAGTTPPTAFQVAELHNLGLTATQVDDALITLSTISSWSDQMRIDIGGDNANRTSASDSAVTTLQSNSVVVNVNEGAPSEPPAPTERLDVIYTSNWETGAIQPRSSNPDGWDQQALMTDPAIKAQQLTVVAAESGITPLSGTYMFKAFFDGAWGNDPAGHNRSELLQPGNLLLMPGNEYWIGFAMYLEDNANNQALIQSTRINAHCFQYHQVSGTGTSGMNMNRGKWNFRFGTLATQTDCGNIVLGQWNKFVLNANVTLDGTGFCKMWINADSDADTPIYNKTGQSCWNANGISMKIGVYRDGLGQDAGFTYARHYYDSFRIARGANANFNSVTPGD